jgi:hypothetical protein
MFRYAPRTFLPLLLLMLCTGTGAATFSFSGNFESDDDVQLFRFAVDGPALNTVTLVTLSYAGGVSGAGNVVAAGGFDPVLALFDATGTLIAEDDDGRDIADSVTGESLDAFLQIGIPAGTYFAALTQTPNFALGPLLSAGFELVGTGDFAGGFVDVFGNQRDGHWAVDIVDAASATLFPVAVPEPATAWLIAAALLMLGARPAARESLRRCRARWPHVTNETIAMTTTTSPTR